MTLKDKTEPHLLRGLLMHNPYFRDISVNEKSSAPSSQPIRSPEISVSGFVIPPLLSGETHGVPVFVSKRKSAADSIETSEESLMDDNVSSAN
jgi:hypothetical protein